MKDERLLHRVFGPAARRATLLALFAAGVPLHGVKITEYTVPTSSSGPYTITSAYGVLVFTEFNANKIGFMTTAGFFQEKTIPQANTGPTGIALGPDNKVWFTEGTAGAVNTLDETGNFGTPVTGFSGPNQIVGGADGRIWFTAQSGDKIEALAAAQNAPASQELVAGSGPLGITLSPGGELFYVLDTANQLCQCVPGAPGCGCFSVTPPLTPASGLRRIVTDRSGQHLWFTERTANKIGTAFSGTGGGLVEYTVPTASSAPLGITAGPDGNIWFTEQNGNKIGRITPAGVITEYPIPTPGSGPTSICVGPDGNLYFTENSTSKIGKLEWLIRGDVTDDGLVNVADVFYLINYLFAGGPAPK
ncbi:MAG TPA: hypothetical protein VKF32_13795 [Thermoanaerobaculia bacterium]|nr:hypothetical protein [Thermoanaerobaculia bacterium]